MSWLLTIPAGCLLVYGLFLLWKAIGFRNLIKQTATVPDFPAIVPGFPATVPDFPVSQIDVMETAFQAKAKQETVSVIIAARNEGNSIAACLKAALAQDYPAHLLEIIVVNDHSTDNTLEIAQKIANKDSRLKVISLSAENIKNNAYKKAAISLGIAQSSGTIIVTTDADCLVPTTWISTLINYFDAATGLVSGPVALNGQSIFQQFQALESMGLIAVGAASISRRKPNMCNGANLAYRREAWLAVNGFEGIDQIPSGDDELLMHKIAATGKYKLRFAASKQAIVNTAAAATWREFRDQRIRWVSKSRYYNNKSISLVLVCAWVGMLTFPLAALLALVHDPKLVWLLALAFAWKTLTEAAVLFQAAVFFNKLRLLWLLPLEQIFHIAYVLWVGIAGNLQGYEWKGRK